MATNQSDTPKSSSGSKDINVLEEEQTKIERLNALLASRGLTGVVKILPKQN